MFVERDISKRLVLQHSRMPSGLAESRNTLRRDLKRTHKWADITQGMLSHNGT